jgi:endoglucanase
MKQILWILICIPVVSAAQTTIAREKVSPYGISGIISIDKNTEVTADSIAPDHTGMRNISSFDLSKEMIPGWNVGNSLDAVGGETAWGNPLITQRLIDSIKAAGFKSVRIPVAWSKFTDQTLFTIDPAWLNRVEEVVNYVLKDSMYAMINEHWDNGWMQPTYAQQVYVNTRLAVMWRQIATHFRNYGDRLIFAGSNEVMVTNNYNTPTVEYYTVQNSFNQTFITAVRSTGGRNAYRYLAVQGFNTNIDNTNNFFVMPSDAEQTRLLVEVHYYDPYDFTINTGAGYVTQWGQNAPKSESWANESYADGQFQKMKTKFIDKGYGVLLGEYGAMARLSLGSTALNTAYAGYRHYYMQYITRSLERHGLVPMYWDNGYTGDNNMGIFNRSTGAQAYPDIIKALVDTTSINSTGVESQPSMQIPSRGALQQNFPNPFNPSTNISFNIPSRSFVTLKIVDLLGKEVATIVSEQMPAGTYSRQWNTANEPSGVYFCQMQAGAYRETKKLVLLR